MLLSATPMINEPNEVAPLMNLLLPLDKQMPTNPSYYDTVTLEQLNHILEVLF